MTLPGSVAQGTAKTCGIINHRWRAMEYLEDSLKTYEELPAWAKSQPTLFLLIWQKPGTGKDWGCYYLHGTLVEKNLLSVGKVFLDLIASCNLSLFEKRSRFIVKTFSPTTISRAWMDRLKMKWSSWPVIQGNEWTDPLNQDWGLYGYFNFWRGNDSEARSISHLDSESTELVKAIYIYSGQKIDILAMLVFVEKSCWRW